MKNIFLFVLAIISLLNCKSDDQEIKPSKTLILNTNLYPNPCRDYFIVDIKPRQYNYTLLLHNLTGDIIWKTEIPTGTYKVEVDTLKEGLYLLSIISKDTVNERFIIDR
jgi:hypothetical protein